MSELINFAERELDIIGMTEDADGMDSAMRKHILHMMKEFADEGHSGFSASYAINILSKLLKYEPLTAITGEDSEWTKIAEGMTFGNQGTLYQNKRCFSVFKDDDGAYDSNGKVFVEKRIDKDTGEEYTSSYTGKDSRVPVVFPYTPKIEYVDMGLVTDDE